MSAQKTSKAGVTILVPARGRPQHLEPLLESIHSTVEADVLFLVSSNDARVIQRLDALRQTYLLSPPQRVGDYARKINTGYRHCTTPLVFLGATDLKFHKGWFEAATAKLTNGIGVVGTNDLGNSRTQTSHSTHSLVTREYVEQYGTIDEAGKILHEGYVHEFVDDELIMTARKRKAYAHASDSFVEHLHPDWGKGEMDASYRQQKSRMRESIGLYRSRSRLWT
jgi:hypothetical protein